MQAPGEPILADSLELETFGGVALRRGGQPLTGKVVQPRRLALLSVLAAAGSRGVSRDKLLGLLWPDTGAEEARHSLSQWLFLLRRDLEVRDVIVGAAELRLNPEHLTADVTRFDEAVARKDPRTATEIYRGPFLDGFFLNDAPEFAHWLDRERALRHAEVLGALETLARAAEARGDLALAIGHWRRMTTLDPLNGTAVRNLMSALAAAGDPATALQVAKAHEETLQRELDAPLSPQVAALMARLQGNGGGPSVPAEPTPDHGRTANSAYFAFVRERLKERFVLDRTIGRTSIVTAFEGRGRTLDDPVTVKVLLPELVSRADVGRVISTLEAASRVRHAGIAPMGEVGSREGLVFTAGPRLAGETLRDVLDRARHLPVARALDITTQLAAALESAEVHGVSHLDLTPRRIRLIGDDVLLVDLGFMHAVLAGLQQSPAESGAALGTLAYMSPEQLAGEPAVGRQCDIYSLGCILFQMLAGEPPHNATSSRALLARRLREPAASVRESRDRVPKSVDDLLGHMLARVPADRIATAEIVHGQLRAIRESLP